MDWPFDPFLPLSYDLIFADPPWTFKHRSAKGLEKSAGSKYRLMKLDEISAMPVGHLAGGDCLLVLMATNPMLPQALKVMQDWGFKFKTGGHWSKKTKHGKQAMGTGYILRCAGEPFLVGKIGWPETTKATRSVIEGLVREHSRKPEELYTALEQLMPNARRIELFGRQSRPGWDVWGDQSTHFDKAA